MSAPITVVVLNWNGAGDTLECLASLRRSTVDPRILVVDNGSRDDSVARIRAAGLADELIELPRNVGFAAASNVGLRHALDGGAEIVAVLNNDTVVGERAIEALLAQLDGDAPRALSPDVRYYDEPAVSWFAGGVIERGWTRHLQPSELPSGDGPLRPSEWLSGCCIAARAETWRSVGLFDPGLFITFEDSDWSLRARRAGIGLYVATESTIRHKVSRTFVGAASRTGSFYFVRNGLLLHARYHRRHVLRFALAWVVRPSLSALRRRPLRRELAFRWLGLLAFATGQRGPAPDLVERLAGRWSR